MCIRDSRIRAEQSVNIVRAAIIKAYLNRLNENNNHKKLDIMLDKENHISGQLHQFSSLKQEIQPTTTRTGIPPVSYTHLLATHRKRRAPSLLVVSTS